MINIIHPTGRMNMAAVTQTDQEKNLYIQAPPPVRWTGEKKNFIPQRVMNFKGSWDFSWEERKQLYSLTTCKMFLKVNSLNYFSILLYKMSNKDPCRQHLWYKRMQACCSGTASLWGWMYIVSSLLHFKCWRSRGELEEERKKRERRRMSVTVRQRWSFIQHTGGHRAVNKGSKEKKKKQIPFHLCGNMTEE